jgi:peptide/nickel transport system substrate-binding protein
MRRRLAAMMGCFAVAAVLAGCGQHERFGHDPDIVIPTNNLVEPALVPGVYGGSLTQANQGDPKTFNLMVSDDQTSGNIIGEIYDALEERDPYTLQYIPRLAYLPKISPDGLTYTFTLRPNLKWSDGQPLTADDVIFTLDVAFDPTIQTIWVQGMQVPVKQPDGRTRMEPFKYRKIDERTVQFSLPVRWAPAMEMFGFNILPKHSLEASYKSGQFNSAWGIDTPPSEMVGAGPYNIVKYVPGQYVIYTPNPYFWRYAGHQHMPFMDKFVYNITPDINAEALNFRSGASDELGIPLQGLPLSQYPSFARYARRDNYTVIDTGPDWGTGFLVFNENSDSSMSKTPALLKLFQNKLFRQACSYALDRQTVCNDLYNGLAKPAYGPVSPADTVFYDHNIKQYPFNLAKARQLLMQIGMTPGPDGKLEYEGQPISFTILTSTEGRSKDIATIMVNDYRQIGLDVQQSNITFENLGSKISSPPYDWEAVIMGFGGGPEPNDISDLWRTASVSHLWWPKEPHPETPWEARVEDDFTKGAEALSIDGRKKYYDDWQQVAAEEQPMVYIDTGEVFCVLRNHYGNVKPCSTGGVLWNLEEMFDTHVDLPRPAG